MADVSSISALGAQSPASKTNSSEATQSNFLNLLVAQLRNQDPLDPVKNEDFIAQLAQLESLDQSKKMADSLATIVTGQQFSSASTLIGKEVIGAVVSEDKNVEIKGIVKSISQAGGKVTIKVLNSDGAIQQLEMKDVAEIREAPVAASSLIGAN